MKRNGKWVLKVAAALILVLSGGIAANGVYAWLGFQAGSTTAQMVLIAFATLICFGVATVARRTFENRAYQAVAVFAGAYLAMVGALYGVAFITGDVESTMWIPLIILFGIPAMLPVVALTAIAAMLVIPSR